MIIKHTELTTGGNVKYGSLSTSYRRRRLDKDLTEACSSLQGLVLELGGGWQDRRGAFRPPQSSVLRWLCANITPAVAPDIVADAARIPLCGASVDAVICTEVLEHVISPEMVLAETSRLLRPGGHLIVSMPFMARVHGAPVDYQRFTAEKLTMLLTAVGFHDVSIRPQGFYFTVLADMVRGGLAELRSKLLRRVLALFMVPILDLLTRREIQAVPSAFVAGHVSGYFIIARK